MARNCFFSKYLDFLLIVTLILSIFQPLSKTVSSTEDNGYIYDDYSTYFSNSDKCYGLVIPLIMGKMLPYTSIEKSTTNLINDLLRLNISVFWVASNFSSLTRTLPDSSIMVRYFERGAFVVPFTVDSSINRFIVNIATDYNIGSEIETYYPVNMFFIMEPLLIDAYQLHYAKCAVLFGLNFGYGDVYAYSDILYSSGFLDTQLILDDEICETLDNKDCNLLVWPGGINIEIQSFLKDVNIKIGKSVRDFVNNGGGYVGSCYGAYTASSGPFFPFYFPLTYLRSFPSYGFLALTSSSVLIANFGGPVTVSLVNRSHPLSFGLNTIQESYHVGGPVFTWRTMDRYTQALGVLDDLQVEWLRNPIQDTLPPEVIEKFFDFMEGKPIYISSQFGKGKVVVFGCHPEFHTPNRQDRIVDNALFYVTSDTNMLLEVSSPMFFSEILAISNCTLDIDLPFYHPIFSELWNLIYDLNVTSKKIDEVLVNVSLHNFRLVQEKNEKEFSSYSHDFYQQWIGLFSDALMKFEQVYFLAKNTTYGSSVVPVWRNRTYTELQTFQKYCLQLYENATILLKAIENYIGLPSEKSQLSKLINLVELLYRQGHKLLNQLWSSTVIVYRNSWYIYESQSFSFENLDYNYYVQSVENRNLSNHENTHEKNQMLYVDDDAYIGGDGSLRYPYRDIQDAIDASCDGDTIFVKKGIYYEHLYIGKSIKLCGEDKNTTIVDGQNRPYHLIAITKPNVELANFTIQNSIHRECGVVVYSSNNTIRGNIIRNNGYGLGLSSRSSNNTIIENQFIHNLLFGTGIDTVTQVNNRIEHNIFRENTIGVFIVNAYNIIRDNSFFNDGIFLSESNDPLVVEIINNTVNNKPLLFYKDLNNFYVTSSVGQILLSNCTNGVIENVTLGNTDVGIFIRHSSNIKIFNCSLSANLIGIGLQSSKDIDMIHNTLLNNSWAGIWISNSENNMISDSFLMKNTDAIYLSSSSFNMITNNSIASNILGLSCWESSKKNLIYANTFIDNYENAFDQSSNQWEYNYWSDWIGLQSNILTFLPYHIKGRIILNFDQHPVQDPY